MTPAIDPQLLYFYVWQDSVTVILYDGRFAGVAVEVREPSVREGRVIPTRGSRPIIDWASWFAPMVAKARSKANLNRDGGKGTL